MTATSPATAEPALPAPTVSEIDAGLEWRRGSLIVRATALRADVLRVRIGRAGAPPPDESWAALAEPRRSWATLSARREAGFSTEAMTVALDPATGALSVHDGQGRPILRNLDAPCRASGPEGFRLDFALAPDAHVFGLGDKFGPLDRRGRAFSLWNTDAYRFQESTDPLYKALPVFTLIQGRHAAGVFLDNTFRSVFDFGQDRTDVMSFGADGGEIDYYVFAGPEPKAVMEAYAWLTGAPPLPPLWSFGFQQSRYSYSSAAEAQAVADRLRADALPADVIWLDIGALDGDRAFTHSPDRFPDFKGFVQGLLARGLKTVIITDLHLAAEPDYPPFDSGSAGDHFLRLEDGSVYRGEVWPGACVFPEFTRASSRAWWGGLFAQSYREIGLAGFWNDMNEPAIFDQPTKTMPSEVRHRIEEPGFAPRTATHAEVHNVYGMLNSRATHEGLLALQPDQRPYVMTRASYAGGQRYAVTWTGDNSATWNHLRLSTPHLLSLGLSGFAFAGVDIGGFAGSPSRDLLTRWLQLGAFNPIMRDHTDNGTAPQEPWIGGEEALAIRRRFIEARYRLLPYIYTAAEEASRTGVPLMRPLFMEFPQAAGGRPLDLDAPAQFMWGEALMVAPSPWPESDDAYDVLLPPGDWYDFWTGEKVRGAAPALLVGASGVAKPLSADPTGALHRVRVTPRIDHLPVFVRAGAIVPSQPRVQSTAETPQGPLTLDVYPGPDMRGDIYLDDGVSLAHLRGDTFRQRFSAEETPDGVTVRLEPGQGPHRPWWTTVRVILHTEEPLTPAAPARPAQTDLPAAVAAELDVTPGEAAELRFVRPQP